MTYPNFIAGEILRAQDMNAVGLWKVASGSIAATTTATNVTGVFSSDYTNYRLTLNITARSTNSRINMRYLVGTTQTATNYYQGGLGSDYGSNTVAYFQRSNNDTQLLFDATTGLASYTIDIMCPQTNTPTRHYGQTSQIDNPLSFAFGGAQTQNLQHTGFNISCNAGTMTVEYAVYGYTK